MYREGIFKAIKMGTVTVVKNTNTRILTVNLGIIYRLILIDPYRC
jgi:hypothetical protein